MDNFNTSSFDIYKDISARTKGEIYLGVIGAVRTGKSTFIKRFMEQMVLPYMNDEHDRERTIDEMPQSAAGKTIMTTEPKFIPKEAAKIRLEDETPLKTGSTMMWIRVKQQSKKVISLLSKQKCSNWERRKRKSNVRTFRRQMP